MDTFWKQVTAQVEIIDMNGQVLMNSFGVISADKELASDVQTALQGEEGVWIGHVGRQKEKVMAAASPILVENQQIGVLRFIASLREIDQAVREIAIKYLSFGLVVILFSGLVSLFLARSITDPLKEVTLVAEEMARGNFKVKSKQNSQDEIGKLSETLNFLASEILKKDQLKNDFISSISHELRTPLTSIKGWAVTLKQGYENKELLQDGLEIIEKESDRLTHMVAELLDFSRFVSGKITLQRQYVDIAGLMGHLRIQLTPRALREEIDFQVICDDNIPPLYSDENRLKQVFINLLDNAFKFTAPGGSVLLKAEVDDKHYHFHIIDNGCGISPEELPRVKEKFFKGKSSKSQNGIGLSLADEIVQLMQGKLELASELGKGTKVTVTLPLQEAK